MERCSCYYQHGSKPVCYGTKEMEECSCGGDESKCNFYPEKRKQKTMTNADRIRAMSDEELVDFICSVYDDDDTFGKFIEGYVIPCYDEDSIKEWLQKPVED